MVDRVVIAIPTCKRPRSLARLLDAIARQETQARISVLVVDNDAEKHQGFDLCVKLGTSYRWPLHAFIEDKRGIAHARNRLVAEALKSNAQFLAMIDDDEWPQADWIAQFLHAWRRTGAGLLQGSILFLREGQGPKPVPDIRHATGPVDMPQGAGNLLIHRPVLETMATPWFDPEFALTGGEDLEFFMRLKMAGCSFAWADEARAFGEVAPNRNELCWVLRRAYSNGSSDMRVLIKHRPGPGVILREAAKIAGALLLSGFLALILGPSPNHRRGPLTKFCRAAGKLTAMMGARYNEYAAVHGE